ncbi:MAG TPA: PucR family transcriptional regulator ligand-binding domain-containing protein [Thermoleophilaceae bacterium]|nr:PucR family transcriptional regulator ligand-binding domain-containing protein [Thermoleophilaceae bacterium]
MLTVRTLVTEVGLELAAGEQGADAPVRWVHITELPDPTPWLSGGELLLTTGIQLDGEERQRDFVRRLSDHHLAGLGFGTGFDHEELPAALVDEAERLGFPVFEVPYELPFIALTEKAFARLVNEQYEVLQRSIGIHKRLERLVLEERGLEEVVRALAAAIGGSVTVLSGRGEPISSKVFRRELPDGALDAVAQEVRRRTAELGAGGPTEASEFAPGHPDLAGRSLVLPVAIRGRGAPHAWLLAARDGGGLGDFERLILNQAVTVVALELMRQRAMRDTERRLAGDVLAEALTGRLSEKEISTRLSPFGIGEQAAVVVFSTDGRESSVSLLEAELDRFLADAEIGALVAIRDRLLCAVIDARAGTDAPAVAERARSVLIAAAPAAGDGSEPAPELRAAVSRPAPVGALRRSFHEARCALEAVALANGSAPPVASYRDLGAFQLLLSLQDDDALRLYCDSVLGPLEEATGEYGDELVRSLEAFIEQNGQWERAARELFCHRHTLRYRMRRVEELTGRDLSSARDRIEIWLALRARELVT